MHLRICCLLLPVVLALSSCLSVPAGVVDEVQVAGKVSLDTHGRSGIEVLAWPADVLGLTGTAPFRSALSAEDGTFVLRLPAGEYYFLARGNGSFAYYGRNPVTVPDTGIDELRIGLVELSSPATMEHTGGENGIAGTVLFHGKPRPGAVAYAYTDLTSRLKGMGYAISAPADDEGRFYLPLPPGTYYLVVRQRQEGGMVMGPLRAGDFIGYAPDNPLRIPAGGVAQVDIPLLEVPEKIGQLAASLFGATSIKGRIVDRTGRPVSGARAILYDEPQMLNRPLYVSQPTGEDGTFVLSCAHGGTYYLAARQQLGGAPAPGELYGTYDGNPEHALDLREGERREGITVVVEAMW